MTKFCLTFLLSLMSLPGLRLLAQDTLSLDELTIKTYPGAVQQLLYSPSAAAVIDTGRLAVQSPVSLLPVLNSVPGVRMEERSPGSYRLSLRGSLLRSPFGIRNVKVYMDDYPLTDAGGNTYLNVIALNAINKIEILKGPDGSLFGANAGGVVTLNTFTGTKKVNADVAGGSYGLFKQSAAVTVNKGKHIGSFKESYQRSGGYRENSGLKKIYMQVNHQWQYNSKAEIRLFAFYSDLFYQTPGGLTLAQFETDPKQARPSTATLPGALEQKAAVYNKILFGGLTHELNVTKKIRYVIAVFGSSVDFKNPFITNYEVRKEKTVGTRTHLIFNFNEDRKVRWEYVAGAEWQQTNSAISNYDNNAGDKGILQAAGDISTKQYFFFNRIRFSIAKKFLVESGLSLNYYKYNFKDSARLASAFHPQWMPRIAASYSPVQYLTLRSSISRGYSPPSTAEIRPSDNNIYTKLRAETGMNIEIGARYYLSTAGLKVDLSVFQYKLKDAVVRQQNDNGAEFFVNAGGTDQRGVELQSSWMLISPLKNNGMVNKVQLTNGITYSIFKFTNYINTGVDYSGRYITGVPKFISNTDLLFEFKNGLSFFIQHNHVSSLPLNDGNTVFAAAYELLQARVGYSFHAGKNAFEIFAGADNVLNQHYSLGNDLNAVGGRYYNAAPLRNYFAGIRFMH
ncbi:MAG: TonB-dependent receptor [Ferruginibacter sp.]